MIDLTTETPMTIEAARHHRLMVAIYGRPPAFTTVLRMITTGNRRGVKLEAIRTPKGLMTTEGAIIRFIERLTVPVGANDPTPSQARKSHRRADAFLSAQGL